MTKIRHFTLSVIATFILFGFQATPVYAFFGFGCGFEQPTNGNLFLGDDDFADVSDLLPAGSTFTVFGKPYGPSNPGIFVGSNGYITFGAGDSSPFENFSNHCDLPRISALFDDLNPTQGGAVKAEFQPSPARLIVTWDGVPEFLNNGSNTFQIILFLYTNKYRIIYDGVAAIDGLVGICEGPTDPDDLSRLRTEASGMQVIYEDFNGGNNFDLDGDCLKGNANPLFGRPATIYNN